MYIRYSIPRAMKSLRGNWRANLNNILILSASLAVLGVVVLFYSNVVHVSRVWLSNSQVSLFLDLNITSEQRQAILGEVTRHPLVRTARIVSPSQGLEEMADRLGADNTLLASAGTEGLPYTIDFEVFVDYRHQLGQLAESFGKINGVAEVVYTERMLSRVERLFNIIQAVGGFFIVLIVLSFFLIISHATRLSLYTRRDEIEILTLVGATRRFIRSSFMIEGMVVALIGCLLAAAIIWGSHHALLLGLTWDESTAVIHEQARFFPPRVLILALVCGVVLGGIGSALSVNRQLRELEP